MKIHLIYDEDNNLDPEEILGEIILSDKRNFFIHEKATYLDSWVFGLIEGLEIIENDEIAVIDLIEESKLLKMQWLEDNLVISYGNQKIFLDNIDELKTELREAALNITRKFSENEKKDKNQMLNQIENFAFKTDW